MATTKIWPSAARWLLALLAAAYAIASLQSGADRLSKRQPLLEQFVAGPFRGDAALARAATQISLGDSDAAMAAGIAAVAARPYDSASSTLLAAALLQAQRYAQADAAFRVAAAGGWRSVITQIYWTRQSAASGEWDLAAARLDAILRANPDMADADSYRAMFEEDPEGRAALARKLAERPGWMDAYLRVNDATTDDVLLRRASLLNELAANDQPLGCEAVRPFVAGLIDRTLLPAADGVWQNQCPGADAIGSLGDGNFDQVEGGGVAGWTVHAAGDVSVAAIPNETGMAARIESTASAARNVLSQPVRFRGPSVTLAWKATHADGAASDSIDVSLDCGKPERPPLQGGQQRTLAVPDCEYQMLRVWIASGRAPVILDDIAQVTP